MASAKTEEAGLVVLMSKARARTFGASALKKEASVLRLVARALAVKSSA